MLASPPNMFARGALAAFFAALCLAACGGGSSNTTPAATRAPTPTPTPAATPTPDLFALAALLEGRYQGTWNNTTFGSTGPITVDVKVDRPAASVNITLTLGGNVFGSAAPAPETISIKPQPGQTTYTGKSNTFGDLSANFSLTGLQGGVTMKASNVPNPRVAGFDASTTITDPRSFSGRYTITFKDGSAPAQGTFTLAKTA